MNKTRYGRVANDPMTSLQLAKTEFVRYRPLHKEFAIVFRNEKQSKLELKSSNDSNAHAR